MIIRQRRGKQISALLLMTVILCCGCSNHSSWQKAKDRYVVGVVTKSNTSEYWMSVNSGMEAAAAKYDMDVITLAPDSELDREVQEKQVEKLIDQNVDALAVAPIDSYHVPDYLDEIEKKKITAVCFDNGMVGGELPYIGIDNHKTGYQLAQELAEQLDHKGQVGIVAGDLKQKGHRERVEGFRTGDDGEVRRKRLCQSADVGTESTGSCGTISANQGNYGDQCCHCDGTC